MELGSTGVSSSSQPAQASGKELLLQVVVGKRLGPGLFPLPGSSPSFVFLPFLIFLLAVLPGQCQSASEPSSRDGSPSEEEVIRCFLQDLNPFTFCSPVLLVGSRALCLPWAPLSLLPGAVYFPALPQLCLSTRHRFQAFSHNFSLPQTSIQPSEQPGWVGGSDNTRTG